MTPTQISRTGLDVEWQRLQVIAQNLASVDTSRTLSGQPVRAMRLVSAARTGFADLVAKKGSVQAPSGVEVVGVEPVGGGVRRVYEPENPQADKTGFVTYPAIDHAGEMTLLIKTSRAYEANLTALNIAGQMESQALQLGRQS
ncbi:flagellar basal body rod protein FlgC [Sphingomonas oligophenolica]|uniref:Flagellar basal-body rod protein FlgC n=1 Tax=Sphingomonas oligophenolica TaxID=301154 RepID=A0ABU9Y408_9SPHN